MLRPLRMAAGFRDRDLSMAASSAAAAGLRRLASGIPTPDVGDALASAGAAVPLAKARAEPHRLASGILVPDVGEGLGAAGDPDRGCAAVAGPSTLQELLRICLAALLSSTA